MQDVNQIQDSLEILGKTVKNIDLFITEQLKARQIDLTKVQLMMLLNLKESDGMTQQVLARITHRDKASIARLIDTMERKGLVVRVSSESDRRINHVYITEKGLKHVQMAEPALQQILQELFTGMSQEDIIKMIELLRKVDENTVNAELVS